MKNTTRRIVTMVLLALCTTTLSGCPFLYESYMSDGTMNGINGYEDEVSAVINVDPNGGSYGTPVSLKVTFSKGENLVKGLTLYDANENNKYTFLANPFTRFRKVSSNVWEMYSPDGQLALTGITGVGRIYATGPGGKKICVGDVYINGATRFMVPRPTADGIEKPLPLNNQADDWNCVSIFMVQ